MSSVYVQTFANNSYNTKDYTYYGVELTDSMWHDQYITQIKFNMYTNFDEFSGTLYLNHVTTSGTVTQIASGTFNITSTLRDVEFTGLSQSLGSSGCHIMVSGFPTASDEAIELRTSYLGNQVPTAATKAPVSRMNSAPPDTSQTELPIIEITYQDEPPTPGGSGATFMPPPVAPVYI